MKQPTNLIIACLMFFTIVEVISAQSKPNIVVILADDLGYISANCYGAPKTLNRTSHIDYKGARKLLATQLEPQLYNPEQNIKETNNRINDEPEIAEDLQNTLDEIREIRAERKNRQDE